MLVLLLACTYANASLCSALIILEFDGSWRPSPQDPIRGFRAQTAPCSTTASASAALLRSDVEVGNSAEERLFAIGAKSLSDARTSADAEYEGLLMGLGQLEKIALSSNDVLGEQELIIRGDCKAVIDQLNSRSNPRKTEQYYEEALEKIQDIRDCSSVTTITFEHVPRENNTLCDALCKLVSNIDQKRVVASIKDLICLGEEESLPTQNAVSCNNNIRKRSIKQKSFHLKSNHYEVAMEEIINSSRLCHSSRLALTCLLTKSAVQTKDVAVLLQMSNFFLQSSRMFTKIYWGGDTGSITATKETLRTVSILSELFAMLFIGADQEVQQLRTKHKLIAHEEENMNDALDSILRLCTDNNKQDDVLFPYSEVFTSKLIDGLNYYQQMVEWNSLANECGLLQSKSGTWLTIN